MVINEREKQVLMLTVEGLKLKEIEERMSATLPAVKMLKHRAMRKAGVRGTAQLIRYAVKQGWIEL